MQSMTERQYAGWQRIRARGKTGFVVIAAALWFAVFGLMPLSFFIAHAIVPQILPVLLGVALVSGLLVGDVAWHFIECGYLERTGRVSVASLARRRQTLSWYLALPCVVPSLSLLAGITVPSRLGIVIGSLCVLALLVGALVVFERSMRRTD